MNPGDAQKTKLIDPTAYKILGDLHFSEGQYEVAITQYIQAVELNPEYLEAWNKIHDSLVHLERMDDAELIQSKITELKAKTQSEPLKKGVTEAIVSPTPDLKQKSDDRPLSAPVEGKNRFRTIHYIVGGLVLVVIVAAFIFSIGGLPPTQTPPQQRETILDTSFIVSGWWMYNITGGHTYEIQVHANQPVTLYMCESIDYPQNGEATCGGEGFLIIFESLTEFNSEVISPPEVRYLFLRTQQNDTQFNLNITRIS